jgi:hypothetical protein
MADEKMPMIELRCKNTKCGRALVIELGTLFENKGRADCPECGQHNYYDPKKGKLLK